MRITAEKRNATRRRIMQIAVELFRSQGFDVATTRDIASAAEIATGTLFNYFDTKEAIVVALAGEALSRAREELGQASSQTSLEEDLFALIAAELRQLKPLRKFIAPFLERVLSPIIATRRTSIDELRITHLELVAETARRHGLAELPPVALQMYWSLYIGVLAFWAGDKSPKQEDTLALMDESVNMFATWLCSTAGE